MPRARFVTDTSLDWVARRLRLLGFDVLTVPGAGLDRLFEVASHEGRTVLTLSRRRPPRHARVPAVFLDRSGHVARLESWLQETLGRALPWADETGGAGEPGGGGC